MQKISFEKAIYVGNGNIEKEPREGYLVANGIVARQEREPFIAWMLMHVPTGQVFNLGGFKTLKLATRAAKEISKNINWEELKTVEEANSKALVSQEKQRVREIFKYTHNDICTGHKEATDG